jgi:hypothetical protein
LGGRLNGGRTGDTSAPPRSLDNLQRAFRDLAPIDLSTPELKADQARGERRWSELLVYASAVLAENLYRRTHIGPKLGDLPLIGRPIEDLREPPAKHSGRDIFWNAIYVYVFGHNLLTIVRYFKFISGHEARNPKAVGFKFILNSLVEPSTEVVSQVAAKTLSQADDYRTRVVLQGERNDLLESAVAAAER